MNASEIDISPKPPAYLCPPKDHTGEEFKDWCVKTKKLGYADQYIAAVAGVSVNTIRRIIGKRKKH